MYNCSSFLAGGETPAAIHSGSAATLQPYSWLQSADTLYSVHLRYSVFDSNVNSTLLERTILPTAKQLYRFFLVKPLQPKFLDRPAQSDPLLAYCIRGVTPAALLSIVIVCLHYVIICKVWFHDNPQRIEYREKEICRPQARSGFKHQRRSRASSCIDSKQEVSYNQVQVIDSEQHKVSDLAVIAHLSEAVKPSKFKKPTARFSAGDSWKHLLSDYVKCSIHPYACESVPQHVSYDADARFRRERCNGAGNGRDEQSQ